MNTHIQAHTHRHRQTHKLTSTKKQIVCSAHCLSPLSSSIWILLLLSLSLSVPVFLLLNLSESLSLPLSLSIWILLSLSLSVLSFSHSISLNLCLSPSLHPSEFYSLSFSLSLSLSFSRSISLNLCLSPSLYPPEFYSFSLSLFLSVPVSLSLNLSESVSPHLSHLSSSFPLSLGLSLSLLQSKSSLPSCPSQHPLTSWAGASLFSACWCITLSPRRSLRWERWRWQGKQRPQMQQTSQHRCRCSGCCRTMISPWMTAMIHRRLFTVLE